MKRQPFADNQNNDLDTTDSSSELTLGNVTCGNVLLRQDRRGDLHKGQINKTG